MTDRTSHAAGVDGGRTEAGGPAASRYTVTYSFDGRAWIAQVREIEIATFGRTLAAAKRHARSALAVHLEVDDLGAADVAVVDVVRMPGTVGAQVERLAARRAEAETLRAEVADATRRTAAELRRHGLSTRDVGEILGISGARVARIERDARQGRYGARKPSEDGVSTR